MRVIAGGCEHCCPEVDPQGPREDEHHYAIRLPGSMIDSETRHISFHVIIDGARANDCSEIWVGTPGRVIRYDADGNGVHLCPCRPAQCFELNANEHRIELPEPGIFRQLVEYDSVKVGYQA